MVILNGLAQTVITNPTSPWTVPAGVTSIKVEVRGGGGAGGGCNSSLLASFGSGGGGGAYNVSTLTVSVGQTYTISRGVGGTGSSDANGNPGTASSVSGPGGSVSANPGSGGARRGGKGGTGGTGGFNSGGNGGTATSNGAGGGGGAGNATPTGTGNGGNGSNTAAGSAGAGALPGGAGGTTQTGSGNGNVGTAPGGGGGGGRQGGSFGGAKSGGAGAAGQVVITYSVSATPTIVSFSPSSACSGSGLAVSITGTNFTGATAVTFYNGQSASFTVISATQITATLPAGATSGQIRVTTPSGTGISSGSFTVNALPGAPTVGTRTQPTCVTSTGSVVLNGLPATGTWTLTRTPGGIITTGNGTSTTITGLAAGTYTYTVTNASGCTSPASANIVINAQPVTPAVPAQTASISSGATFTVSPVGGTIPPGTTYTWTSPAYTGGVTGGSAQAVPQITISGTLTIPSGSGTATYTVTPTSGICIGATFTVTVTVTSACVPVTIGTQPTDNIICSTSGNASFTVAANGSVPYTYQWQYRNGNTWAAVLNGTPSGASYTNATASTLSVSGITAAGIYQYRCYITNCSGANNATSVAANLTVNALPVPTLISSDADNVFCSGTSVTFTAGGGTGYNFRVGGLSVQNGVLPTFTTNSLTNGQVVDVIVVNPAGCSATSAGITNTVSAVIPTLISSDADNAFCSGTNITFTAGGGTGYNFRVGGVSVQNGVLPTYTTNSLTNGQVVDVIVTNATGCSATSAQIQNIVNPIPFIIISASPACSVDYLTYYFGVIVPAGVSVTSTSGIVANTGGNVWSITAIPANTNVTIGVTVSGGCQNSQLVTAPNCSCPIITAPVSGGDKSYCALGIIPALTATVSTVGSPETVDWYNASSGGTELLRGSISYTPTAPGTYFALAREISSNCVSSTRTPIALIMNPLPIPTLTSSDADNIICSGASVTFTAGGGTTYNFRVGGVSVQNGSSATFTTSSLTNNQLVDVIVTNANGCTATSASILNTISALPVPTLTSSDADNRFCAGTSVTFTAGGGTSYNFRVGGISVQIGVSATYTTTLLTDNQVVDVIVTNANGCSATSAGIINTVFSSLTATLTSSDADNIFCSGTSVTFTATGGTSYNFRVGGVSVQNGTSATYTTSSLTNGQTVDVIATNASGCTAVSPAITNIVNPSPSANAGNGGDECDLDFKFNAVPGIGTGTWTLTTGPGTVTFAPNANTATATATVTAYGTYTFTWTEVAGTCSKSTAITVNFYQQPVANAGTGGNNCGLEFYLNGSVPVGTGTWSKVSGPGNVTFTPNANASNALVAVTAYGSYTFRWTVVNGTCSNSSTVNVNSILQAPSEAGPGGSECDKDFIFNAQVPVGTGTWTKVSGPGNAVFSPDNHQPNAKVTIDQFGAYRFAWIVVNVTCTSSDVVDVVFHDLPSVSAGPDLELCKGSSIQLNAQGTGTFAWSPPALVNNPAIRNPIATPVTTTTFTVVLTDQFGCKNSDDVIVSVREKTVANAGTDQVLEYLFKTTLNAFLSYPSETGVWSVVSGTGNFNDKNLPKTSVDNLSVGVNKFLWTVTNKVCPSSSDSVNIEVHDFVIPTLITPNMDGNNDYFVLRGLSTLGKTELIIFDRRGAQVYKNSDYDNSWNGLDYNGNPLPEDTYYYVLKAVNGKSLSGYIVIRR